MAPPTKFFQRAATQSVPRPWLVATAGQEIAEAHGKRSQQLAAWKHPMSGQQSALTQTGGWWSTRIWPATSPGRLTPSRRKAEEVGGPHRPDSHRRPVTVRLVHQRLPMVPPFPHLSLKHYLLYPFCARPRHRSRNSVKPQAASPLSAYSFPLPAQTQNP